MYPIEGNLNENQGVAWTLGEVSPKYMKIFEIYLATAWANLAMRCVGLYWRVAFLPKMSYITWQFLKINDSSSCLVERFSMLVGPARGPL